MSLVVTGSIGIDDVKTPYGQVEGVLGGSVVYFALSAALLSEVRVVGAVGEDFPSNFRSVLEQRRIDLRGLETRKGSRTFRWAGRYESDLGEAQTTHVDLNVLAEAPPPIPSSYQDSKFVFLAATHPDLQRDLAQRFTAAELVVCDTRDLWLNNEKEAFIKLLNQVSAVVLNDHEASLFTDQTDLIRAGRRILEYGPRFAIVKKGQHGAMLVTSDRIVALPSFPTDKVKDPTGAGDSFAGGLMGYLAGRGRFELDDLPRAMACGTVVASFAIEDFSTKALEDVTPARLEDRLDQYVAMLKLD